MKFAHFADCHIGAFRDIKLRNLNMAAFEKAASDSLSENVDFILISGDLFNTSIPSIDSLKRVVKTLKELRKRNTPVYIIAGSHYFSPSGKTMIDVLEEAELVVNVVKGNIIDEKLSLNFTIDRKTGAKITGIIGKRGMLDKKFYQDLDRNKIEKEFGFKIFMFHTTLSEFKTEEFQKLDSVPISILPKNFDYYAGGHLHFRKEMAYDKGHIVYPGPLFPASFREIETLKNGSYCVYDNGKIESRPINIINVHSIKINCEGKNPIQVQDELKKEIKNKEFLNTIVTIRLHGILESGKTTDIDWKEIYQILEQKQAYFVARNTDKLVSKEFSDINVEIKSAEEIEENIINEHIGKLNLKDIDEKEFIKDLMQVLSSEKQEGEKNYDFEKRILENLKEYLNKNERT